MDGFIRYCLVFAVTSSLISVFLSGIFLGIAVVAWLCDWARTRRLKLAWPAFFPFVLVFAITVLLAILFSADVLESFRYTKKFVHFFAVILVYTYFDRRLVRLTAAAAIGLSVLSAGLGVFQYFYEHKVSLLGRITGLMSHWMTFSGQLMICSILLGAYLLALTRGTEWRTAKPLVGWFAGNRQWLWFPGLLMMLFVLILTLTRSAWVGCVLGFLVLAAVRSYRLVVAGAVLVIVVAWLLPARFNERLYSSFDLTDTTNRVRVELLRTGSNCIRAHPWVGIGPRMIRRDYETYRVSHEFPGWAYQHLHNNVVQIAAEMGILTLVAWLALWVKIAWDQVCFVRAALREGDRLLFWTASGALGVLAGFLSAGLFEYNFGDSEVLSLVLFSVTAPYICRVDTAKAGVIQEKVSVTKP